MKEATNCFFDILAYRTSTTCTRKKIYPGEILSEIEEFRQIERNVHRRSGHQIPWSVHGTFRTTSESWKTFVDIA